MIHVLNLDISELNFRGSKNDQLSSNVRYNSRTKEFTKVTDDHLFLCNTIYTNILCRFKK